MGIEPSTPQVDGITSGTSGTPLPVVPPADPMTPPPASKPKGLSRFSVVILCAVAFVYTVPGLFLLSIFPRTDGSLQKLRALATLGYEVGGAAFVLFGLVALLRIQSVKDHPRLKFFAAVRIACFLLPTLLISALVPILINAAPSLALEIISPASAQDLVAPVPVTFGMQTALSYFRSVNLTPLKYDWDFTGDGLFDQQTFEPQGTYIFSSPGVFSVTAQVTMTNGQTKRVAKRIVVPKASFGVDPLSPIIDEPATFTLERLYPPSNNGRNPGVVSARWDFDGDGNPDIQTDKLTVTNTYHKLGTVRVSVSLTLSNQTETSLTRTIEVVKAPEQAFPITMETEPATLLGPPPFGVLFALKTKEPIASAAWDFGNKKTGEGLRVAQVFNTVGSYSVSVDVRSQSGAVVRLSKIVTVTNPLTIPDLTFEGSPDVRGNTIDGEVPLTIDLTPNTDQPLVSFSWDVQDTEELSITDKTLHAVYRDPGTYYIDLIGTDPDQSVFRRRIKIVARPPKSFVDFSIDPPSGVAPATVTFDGSDAFIPGEQITGFEWDFGDASSPDDSSKYSGARVTHVFSTPGSYVIVLSVKTISGKTIKSQKTLVIRQPSVDACFLPSRRSGKAPLGVRFDSSCSTGDFVSWTWDFGDASQSDQPSPTHVYLAAGEYAVTLTAVTRDGSKSVKRTTISVSPP